MRTIDGPREVLLLASGANKALAVAAAVHGEVFGAAPASVLRRHPNVSFLLDRDASPREGGPA